MRTWAMTKAPSVALSARGQRQPSQRSAAQTHHTRYQRHTSDGIENETHSNHANADTKDLGVLVVVGVVLDDTGEETEEAECDTEGVVVEGVITERPVVLDNVAVGDGTESAAVGLRESEREAELDSHPRGVVQALEVTVDKERQR